MKTCPICKATCFDDMEICFGCLHDFSADIIDISDADYEELYSSGMKKPIEESTQNQPETLVVPALTVARNDAVDANGIIQPEIAERSIVITLQGFDKDAVVKIQ